MAIPKKVSVIEVGPRDGLQNEPKAIPTDIKLALIQKLATSGLQTIEATSFVSPKWVPQMADHSQLLQQLDTNAATNYPVLVPNLKGYDNATAAGAKLIAVFTAASESFCSKNTNCSVDESLKRIETICQSAQADSIPVRGYVSCVLGCPYEGKINHEAVLRAASRLFELGCYEVSLGDTIGIGTPGTTKALLDNIASQLPVNQLAMHYHDTYGQALANIYASLDYEIATFDSSVAGLGGCPYAPGATGNVATEDVLYLLEGLGIETGVDINKVAEAGYFISKHLGRATRSKVAAAMKHRHG